MDRTPLRVLFFEDCAEDVDLSLRTLKSACFDVVSDVAVTLEEILDRARTVRYDVILSDDRMPRTTGMECFFSLRAAGVDTPFILLTGPLGAEKAVECLKEGVTDYVLKDRLARLPIAIRQALAQRRLKDEDAKAEVSLLQSEASYRSLIQNAPCGILRLDARNGRLLEANHALSEMLGYASPADLVSNSASGGVALRSELLDGLTDGLKQDGEHIGFEIEGPDKHGNPVVIELKGRLLRDKHGSPACFEMVADNVTGRRSAENRIRQLNRLYSVLSHAGQAIVHIREQSELFREICRVVVEEGRFQMAWIGLVETPAGIVKPVASWGQEQGYLDKIYITTTDEPTGCGPVGSAIKQSRHVVSNDLMADARMAPWLERAVRNGYRSVGAFPIGVGSRTIGALAIYASETEFFDSENVALLDELAADLGFALESIAAEQLRQRAVDELKQFFALSLDMLFISGLDGSIYRMNPAWEQTLGFSAAEMCGTPWVDFVHLEDRPPALVALAGLADGRAIDRLELRFRSKNGPYRWLRFNATPSVEQCVVFGAASDITERKRLEEQLRSQNFALEEQNRRLNEASRMKNEFLANMSHELRSPLNGIIGFSELLYDGKLGAVSEKLKEFLGRIHKSAKHLLQLINSVLDLSRIEAGRLELHAEPVQLSSLVEEVIATQGAMAAEKKIRIETELHPDIDSALTDAERFKQVLYSYLSNALKFTNDGGIVSVRLQPEGSSEFRLEVSDTGIGIAPKDLPRLFTEFQQLDSTASKRYQGTGLGLVLAKRIVEAQGGRVGVRSQPGEGTTFFAVLPKDSPALASKPTLLVIEDEQLESFVLVSMLQRAGFLVETAATGAEAIAKCRERRFDAIALDLLLPDESGCEALAAIRSMEWHRQTPVIVVSSAKAQELGALRDIQGFLAKPVDAADLAACLERCGLNQKRCDLRRESECVV